MTPTSASQRRLRSQPEPEDVSTSDPQKDHSAQSGPMRDANPDGDPREEEPLGCSFGKSFDSFLQSVYPDDRDRVMRTIRQAIQSGGKYQIEYRRLTSGGDFKWVESIGRVTYQDDRPFRMAGISVDITERKEAQQARKAAQAYPEGRVRLRTAEMEGANAELCNEVAPEDQRIEKRRKESEQCFRLLVESVKDYAIFMLDPDGRIMTWNMGAERIKGYRPEEIIGKHFSQFYLPEDVEAGKPEHALRMAVAEGRYEQEGWRIRKDGSQFWARVVITALHDRDGNFRGFSKVTQDITERKIAEEALRELSRLVLRLQDEERGRLARELHDGTAQTLSALSLNLALVNRLSSLAGHPQAAKVLSESISLADQASRELRTLSYLLHPPTLDENGLAHALRWYIDGFIQRTQINVDVEITPSELDRLPQDLEMAILRIVQECLTNVYRHAASSTAGVRLVQNPTDINLQVWDQGKGLPDGILDGSEKSGVILGVGIRGMQERVKQLGGRMDVHPGKPGTTIEVVLPIPKSSRRRSRRQR